MKASSLVAGFPTFSWRSVSWSRSLLWGSAVGGVLGFLVGSAAFRWSFASTAGTVFVALLGQPPLTGLLLVGAAVLGGILLGSRRPLKGWVEGSLFVVGALVVGLTIGGIIRLAAGPETPSEVAEVYASAILSFLRIWLVLIAELFLWGTSGLATGMIFNGLRLSRLRIGVIGAVMAALGFVLAVVLQPYLFSVAFPGGI